MSNDKAKTMMRKQIATTVLAQIMRTPWVVEMLRKIDARQKRSTELVGRLREVNVTSPIFWPFHAPPFPISIASANGSRIRDVDGNEYLDMHMGWGAQSLHGHAPAEVVSFVRDRITGTTGNAYFHETELRLSELLKELTPHNEKFALFHSGTDATTAAVRLARAHTGRTMVAKVEGALHGVYDLWGYNTAFWYHGYPVSSFPEDHGDHVAHDPALRGLPPADGKLLVLPHDIERAVKALEQHRNELACVIAEPVSSSFPFEDRAIPFTKALSEAARRLHIPFVLDEVLTGFRCGIGGAAQSYGIHADLITYGKVISGLGLPMSAIGGRAELLDYAQTTGMPLTDLGNKTCLNTTHMGNHLAVCASYATLSLLKQKGDAYYTETRAKADRLRSRLDAFREQHKIPIHLVGFGEFIGALTFMEKPYAVENVRELAKTANPLALFILNALLRLRNVYAFSNPLAFLGGAYSMADIDTYFEAIADSLLEMKANNVPFTLSFVASF
ncbi:MAG TPA: aminotransferase class III-fold pyridoxal phosphate-dependent enzyme [Polyangiales bacterium]|nr:aminotransferase class III-fold pyridoxal phosphate-dependent enzyme [Polyangiales bacterium]